MHQSRVCALSRSFVFFVLDVTTTDQCMLVASLNRFMCGFAVMTGHNAPQQTLSDYKMLNHLTL